AGCRRAGERNGQHRAGIRACLRRQHQLLRLSIRRWPGNALIVAAVLLIAPALAVFALRWVAPPIYAYMLWARWNQNSSAAKGTGIHYHWLNIEAMSACMPLAVVAAEDQGFPYHRGFAWTALRGAMASNLAGDGGGIRGASTISQQTAKNLF